MKKIKAKESTSGNKKYFTKNQFSWNVRGVNAADNGNFKEALKSFSRAIEVDPHNFVSYFNRASVKMRLGDLQGAIRDFRLSEQLESSKSI